MKKNILYVLIPLFFVSCHKVPKSSCGGYFVYAAPFSLSGMSGCSQTLFTIDANISKQISNYQNSIVFGCGNGQGAYDHIHNCYYFYAIDPDSSSFKQYLYSLNFNTKSENILGYPMPDSLYGNSIFNELRYNSKTGKLYSFGQIDSNNVIYEIIYEITPNVGSKLVFVSDTFNQITTPVIDENTGYIYFFSLPNLIKVNPANGTSAIVASYNSVIPDQLQYDNNDGMFYGVNVFVSYYNPITYPQPQSASFISINPNTLAINILANVDYTLGSSNTFDFCNNLYIVNGFNNTYWLEPSSGKIVKQVNNALPSNCLAYINGQLP